MPRKTKHAYHARASAESQDRATDAVRLFVGGRTLAEIGRALQCSPKTVERYIADAKEAWRQERVESIQEMRTREARKLDALEAALWARVGDDVDPLVVQRLIALAERRAKLLGLDARPGEGDGNITGGDVVLRFVVEGAEREP